MLKTASLATTAACVLGMTAMLAAAGVQTGAAAPDFKLTDTNGKAHSLSDFKGKVVVLEWFNYQCPFVVKHYDSGNIPKLQALYTGKDVVWLAIASTNPESGNYRTPEQLNEQMSKLEGAPTAVLMDADGAVGRQYGARTTPHMYVIDAGGVLVYQGAIDSIPSARIADIEQAENYVVATLDAVLDGKPAPYEAKSPYGCSVKY